MVAAMRLLQNIVSTVRDLISRALGATAPRPLPVRARARHPRIR
jgi:hypothetical protein